MEDKIEWCYGSWSGAIVSLLLHMLMNLQKKHDASWMLHYLQHTKEVLILVPLADNSGTMEVVATIFRTTKKGVPRCFAVSSVHSMRHFPGLRLVKIRLIYLVEPF